MNRKEGDKIIIHGIQIHSILKFVEVEGSKIESSDIIIISLILHYSGFGWCVYVIQSEFCEESIC